MEDKGRQEGEKNGLTYEERSDSCVAYRLEKRETRQDEEEGEFCYDLIVVEGEDVCRLLDVARSDRLARAVLKVFREGCVTPLEAPYILEDLMTDPEWID